MTKLRPSPGDGVIWYIPKLKRPVAETTSSTSDLVYYFVEDGTVTFNSIKAANNYDSDLDELCDVMVDKGLGNEPLYCVAQGFVQFISARVEEV